MDIGRGRKDVGRQFVAAVDMLDNPIRAFPREVCLSCAAHWRRRCHDALEVLTDHTAADTLRFAWGTGSRLELHIYNLRHLRHGAAHLSLILRQATRSAPGRVGQVRTDQRGGA